MNNQFEKMQQLAFGKVVTPSPEMLTENTLREKIKELVHSSLGEAKKKKKEDPEDVAPQDDSVDLDMGAEDTTEPTPDMGGEPTDTMSPDVSNEIDIDPKVKAIQDALSKALANAKALNDDKLVNQIGNTITMLVRTQVVGQQVTESLDDEMVDDEMVGNSDKYNYMEGTLLHVWNKGKGNNPINFKSLAKSIIYDLETKF